MSIAFKEGLRIPPPAMEQIITGANQDIRQVGEGECCTGEYYVVDHLRILFAFEYINSKSIWMHSLGFHSPNLKQNSIGCQCFDFVRPKS